MDIRPFRQFDPTSTNYPMAEFNKVMLEDDSVRDWLEKIVSIMWIGKLSILITKILTRSIPAKIWVLLHRRSPT